MKIKVLWIVALAGCLNSCVDTVTTATTILAEGGMTGTGISAGRITGFGSIYVNGVHYQVDQAEFYRDGAKVSGQSTFNMGEFVTVTGTTNSDGSSGTASKVEFDSMIRGEITAASVDNTRIEVMGQSVQTDELTVLHGFSQLSELTIGNVVEVSGTRNAEGVITATSINRLQMKYPQDGSVLRLEGSITQVWAEQKFFQLGGLSIDYASAQLEGFSSSQTLQTGMYVQVESRQVSTGQWLVASKVRLKPVEVRYAQNTPVRLEGRITTINGTTSFTLNYQTIVVNATTRWEGLSAAQLQTDLAVAVEGKIDANGNLVATRVQLRQGNAAQVIRQSGTISAVDVAQQTFTLQGLVFTVDNSSMLLGGRDMSNRHEPLKFSELTVGMQVNVDALVQADGRLNVLRLDDLKPNDHH